MRELQPDEQIKQIDEVSAHRFGPYLVINITVCVDGRLTVREDQIATCVEQELLANIASVAECVSRIIPIIKGLSGVNKKILFGIIGATQHQPVERTCPPKHRSKTFLKENMPPPMTLDDERISPSTGYPE
ncbi:MAG: cation transporter dimerization domain-containing protein [Marinagarivorans sp.]|nr:cation transporter dimerization domain-containing protein [Marinagarivorans sp.]